MEELRAVLFDMDGVLLESKEAWFRVLQAAARHFNKSDIERARFDASWGQGVDADVRDFFPGCTEEQIERFYEEHLLDFGEHVRADAEARSILVALRDLELPRGVITNTPAFLARDMLAWTGLIGLVDATVGAGGTVRPKPDPDVVRCACELLEVEPATALVVGDSSFDEKAAKGAGAMFFAVRMGGKSASKLSDVLRYVEQHRA